MMLQRKLHLDRTDWYHGCTKSAAVVPVSEAWAYLHFFSYLSLTSNWKKCKYAHASLPCYACAWTVTLPGRQLRAHVQGLINPVFVSWSTSCSPQWTSCSGFMDKIIWQSVYSGVFRVGPWASPLPPFGRTAVIFVTILGLFLAPFRDKIAATSDQMHFLAGKCSKMRLHCLQRSPSAANLFTVDSSRVVPAR